MVGGFAVITVLTIIIVSITLNMALSIILDMILFINFKDLRFRMNIMKMCMMQL